MSMTFKEWIEVVLLVVLTGNTVVRWIARRETDDETLGTRVTTLERALEKTERDLKDDLVQQGTRFHTKVGEANVSIGREIGGLRSEVGELRRRIDEHIDRNKN